MKGKRETSGTKTNVHEAYPKNCLSQTNATHIRTELIQGRRKTDKFDRVSYFTITFNQNGICEWE